MCCATATELMCVTVAFCCAGWDCVGCAEEPGVSGLDGRGAEVGCADPTRIHGGTAENSGEVRLAAACTQIEGAARTSTLQRKVMRAAEERQYNMRTAVLSGKSWSNMSMDDVNA